MTTPNPATPQYPTRDHLGRGRPAVTGSYVRRSVRLARRHLVELERLVADGSAGSHAGALRHCVDESRARRLEGLDELDAALGNGL